MILFLLPKSLKFHDLLYFFDLFLFFASYRGSQVHCAQFLGLRHWPPQLHLLLCILYLLPLIVNPWRSWICCVKFHFAGLVLFACRQVCNAFLTYYCHCMLWLLYVLVEVKFMIISSFWSTVLTLLVHHNSLRENRGPVDQEVLEGKHHQPSSSLPNLM